MNDDYFNLNLTRRLIYLKNNKSLEKSDCLSYDIYESIDSDLSLVFNVLNIQPHKLGYKYWKDAVYLYIESDIPQVSICNEIYPIIAKKYKKTTGSIERAMRMCFKDAMYYCTKDKDGIIYGYLKYALTYPHNSEIMAKLSELISSKEFQNSKINLLKSFNN